jgi:hypothetical protein
MADKTGCVADRNNGYKAPSQLAKDITESTPEVDWETADLKDLNEARWIKCITRQWG